MAHIRPDQPDCFVLHCHHDGHPCRHRYEDIPTAIVAAAVGLSTAQLEAVESITFNGLVVMRNAVLMGHIENMQTSAFN